MNRAILTGIALITAAPLGAQWLQYPTPGIPRTPDGKPNLSAPAPRTASGKPDLSGVWRIDGLGQAFNILGDQDPGMLPWAEARFTQQLPTYGREDTDARCLPPGPRAGISGLDPLKIVQTPSLMIILYEGQPDATRQIFTDGRSLPKDPNPAWMGYSVGRWEGETFVVESNGFNDRTTLDFIGHPHSEALHVTERFRRKDFGHIALQVTFDDPKAYRKPWTISVEAGYVPDTELLEYVCNENEKDRSRLVGQIADDRREVTIAPSILAEYAGTYRSPEFGTIRVLADGGRLMWVLPSGVAKIPLFANSETRFVSATGESVQFARGQNAAVTHLVLTLVEGDFRADRVADSAEAQKK